MRKPAALFIGGLTKMLGMLNMHEEIMVRVDLVFAPSALGHVLDRSGRA